MRWGRFDSCEHTVVLMLVGDRGKGAGHANCKHVYVQ